MSDQISKTNFKKHIKQIVVPQGFVASMEDEVIWSESTGKQVFVLKSETIELRFDQSGAGHTKFLQGEHWLSFDRLGVEDSFYHLPWGKWDKEKYDLNNIIKEQLERVDDYLKIEFIQIPGIPFSTTKDKLNSLKQQLRGKQGSIRFMPSGFGTGYVLSRVKGYDAKRAPDATEKFFATAPLYISTFDAD